MNMGNGTMNMGNGTMNDDSSMMMMMMMQMTFTTDFPSEFLFAEWGTIDNDTGYYFFK